MQYKKGTFCTVPNPKKIVGQKPIVQALYLWLCFHANQDGECFPSRKLLAQETNTSVRSIVEAIKILEKLGVVTVERSENHVNVYSIFIGDGSAGGALGGGAPVARGGAGGARGGAPVAHGTKSNELNPFNQTHEGVSEKFKLFWSEYPPVRRYDKAKCEKKFITYEAEADIIIADVKRRKAEDDGWTRDGGRYVPAPLVYLNQRRWESGIVKTTPKQGNVHKSADPERKSKLLDAISRKTINA